MVPPITEPVTPSERMLRLILDNIPQGVFWKDRQSRYLGCNQVVARAFGLASPEAIIGLDDHHLPGLTREQANQFIAHDRAVMERNQPEFGIIERATLVDGSTIWMETNKIPLHDAAGAVVGVLGTWQDITARKRAERGAAFPADIGLALTRADTMRSVLQQCAENMVRAFDAAFARIWTCNVAENMLELQASAGLYTHLDGGHARIPVGQYKIGLIAQEKKPHLTKTVIGDPRVHDQKWAQREGLVAFAGYPLLVEGRTVGVMAIFARQPLEEDVLDHLNLAADLIAQFIERTRAMALLRESEARFRQLIEHAPEAVVILDSTTGRFIQANPAAERLFKLPAGELCKVGPMEMSPPHQPDGRPSGESGPEFIGRALAGETPLFEWTHRDSEGHDIPCEVRLLRMEMAGRRVVRGSVTDITMRRRAEAALRESEERHRLALESASLATWDWNIDTGHVIWNEAHFSMLGYALGSVTPSYRAWADRVHPDDLPQTEVYLRQAMELGGDFCANFRVRCAEGRIRAIEAMGRFKRDESGRAVRNYGVMRDITERQQAEAALRESEERFRAFMRISPLMAWVVAADGTHLYANEHYSGLLGRTSDQVVGRHLEELFGPENAAEYLAVNRRVIDGGVPVETVERAVRSDGSEGQFLSYKFPLPRRDGTIDAGGIAIDITERKRAEEKLQSQQRLMSAVGRVQVQFIDERKPAVVFDTLLRELLILTDSAYGFIGQIHHAADGRTYLRTEAITDIAWNDETRAFLNQFSPNVEFFNLDTLFGHVLITGQPVIANDPAHDPRRGGLPAGHPALNAFLGIPIHQGEQVLGMVGIANRPGGYDDSVIAYLQPFLDACGSLFKAYRTEQQRQQTEAALRESEETIHQITQSVASTTGEDFFQTLVVHLCRACQVKIAFIGVLDSEDSNLVRSVAVSADGRLADNFSYDLRGTPCENVLGQKVCHYPSGVQAEFPSDTMLVDMGIDSYLGTPLISSQGRTLGLMVLLHDRPMIQPERAEAILRVMATRATAEHERTQAEAALRESEERHRLALEAANLATWDWNIDTGKVIWNEAHFPMLGYAPGSVTPSYLTWADQVHPDDLPQTEDSLRQAMERGGDYFANFRVRGPEGRIRAIEAMGRFERDESGRAVRSYGVMRDVTERQQAEATLRESEERFRGLIENLDIGVVLQNAADRILLSNPAAARVLGLTQDQLHGVTSRDPRWKLVRADGSDLPVEEVPSVVAVRTGRPVHNSLLGTTNLQTGGRIWLQVSANPRLAADGAVAHVLVTLVDVTERVRAENALRESEAKFRAIIEASPVPFALNDEGQNIIYLNTAFIKTFGYDRNDIPTLADWWPKAYPDPDYQQWVATTWKAHLERARAAGTPFEPVELNIRCKDGSQRTVLAGAAPLGETFKGVHLVVLHDITERKQAENALRESEERLREATKAANVGLWEWDLRTNLVWYSPEWKRQIGYEVSEISNRFDEWQSRVHPEDLKAALEEVKRLVENPSRSYDTEFRFRHKDGTYRWILAQASVVVGADGMPVRMIGSHLDITARKQAEEERRKLEAQIRHAQKLESLGVLAGGIAHDFNNLLTGILGYADLALMELPAHSSARPLIDEAVNGARKAADLTKQMLAYSGKGRFVVESLNLNDVVEDMAQLLQVSISKKCVLKLHLMPDLACIEADAVQLRQIIMNLIINASDAIGDQSGVIAVTSGVMYCDRSYLSETYLDENLNEGLYVYLEVADTGCGMSAETRARIFDPFFTTKMTGRGLGLAAVLGIVRGHRGAMKIYSELGKGTTFKVAFPAVDLPAHSQPTSGSTDATWRGSGIVLVVDDEEAVRGLARRMLELMGFTVLTARDGREAVEVFRRESDRIRLVLLDMTMPHLDGAETFREMRRIRSDVKAILTSGYNEQSAISQFAGKGLAGFIQKPYRYEELLAVIRSALGS